MVQQRVVVRFVTPAFLGDADQRSGWRTPPFKALLRQWWRIYAASQSAYDYRRLREEEGHIFGHAWLRDTHGAAWALQSRLRLRLEGWCPGKLQDWPKDPSVRHPEVSAKAGMVGAHLYLGYGPLIYQQGTKMKSPPAIDAGEEARLFLTYPDGLRGEIEGVLQLVQWFGTVGARSRNGWGSIELEADGIAGLEGLKKDHALLKGIARPLEHCLELDWPHSLGLDDDRGVLVWCTTRHFASWEDVMKMLAEVKIGFRTKFPFKQNRDAALPAFECRHLLAYPVTNHGVLEWSERDKKTGKPVLTNNGRLKQTERLANQLRFKVLRAKQGYVGIVAHFPCSLPRVLCGKLGKPPSLQEQINVWKAVHQALDGHQALRRL